MHTLVHHDFCVLHQLALIVKYHIERTTDYIRQLATMTNTWRTGGTAWKVRAEWTRLFGEASAEHSCKCLPQRALKGRWGYIDGCEAFYIKLEPTQLAQVFAAVWPAGDQELKRKKRSALVCSLEGADLDDDDNYGEKIGRWIRESIAAVNDERFWAQLHVQHYSREPIAHAMRAVQKNNSMLNLVAHVVPEVLANTDALIGDDMAQCWVAALKYTPDDAHNDLMREIMCACCSSLANFIRRVQLPCESFPRLLVWLVCVDQGVHSDFIGDVCKLLCGMMDSAPGTVDNFTLKVWSWFSTEFRSSATDCVVPHNLHTFIADLSASWVVDSQYVEGCNGVLKKIVTTAPGIHLALLSTRTTVKRMLDLGGEERARAPLQIDDLRRWSMKEDRAKECATRHADPAFRSRLDGLIADPSRWSVLDPAETPIDEYAPAPAPHAVDAMQRRAAVAKGIDQQFAAEMLCALKDLFKARNIEWLPSARVALESIWVSSSEGEAECVQYWMASITYYSQLWMVKCEVQVRRCNDACCHGVV